MGMAMAMMMMGMVGMGMGGDMGIDGLWVICFYLGWGLVFEY